MPLALSALSAVAPAPRARTRRRKGRLFCPDCDHGSAVDGDWHLSATPRGIRHACPACDAVVVTQPAFGPPDDGLRGDEDEQQVDPD